MPKLEVVMLLKEDTNLIEEQCVIVYYNFSKKIVSLGMMDSSN